MPVLPSAPIAAFETHNNPVDGDLLVIVDQATGKTKKMNVARVIPAPPSTNYKWVSSFDYPEDAIVEHNGQWYLSLQTPNVGQVPGLQPLYWELQTKSSSGFVFWSAGVYTGEHVFVLYEIEPDQFEIYYLLNATRPFLSVDFETELTAGDWGIVSGGQSHFKGVFANEAALDSAFPTAEPGDYALVDTAGPEAALYIWDDTDTDWVASGVTTVVPPWDAATPGLVERSLTAEAQNIVTRTAAGSSDGTNSDARTPSEKGLVEMLLSFLTTAWTWTLQQTFTAAIKLSSTTADQFLRTNASKEVVSVAAASAAQMITGTDNVNPATAKSVEDKGSVKLRDVSNAATGTNNIDCQNQDTVHVVFTTALTGANEITVSNASNLQILNVVAPVTGSSIAITVPSTTRMDRVMESGSIWNQGSKILTVGAVGTADLFEFSFKRAKSDGSVFILRHGGPARA